ncbi:MAG: hypothetical protein LKF53_08200 [Solobacterium sp.]|jgi:hypothetical protein|nr:hypothetical protein [Solobacterium sp.]MCH4206358.1 hypothetical protein [Solobacterium sp.]MCH4227860.1 hypothetical protein [Solobacterium sp.]MCH4283248.1 hypothetical protein [Solobacterium sp.]
MILHTRQLIVGISAIIFSSCLGCVSKDNVAVSPDVVPSAESQVNASIKYTKDIGSQHMYQISIPKNESKQKFQVTIAIYQDDKWSQENKFSYHYESDAVLACGISGQSADISYGSQQNESVKIPSSFANGNETNLWKYTNMNQSDLAADKDTMLIFLSLNCRIPQSDVFVDWKKFEGDGAAAISIKLIS